MQSRISAHAGAAANDVKASFDEIYDRPDPRDYFSVLGSLDYAIPDLARPIFRQVAAAWRREHARSATLLDLGASYGINAALFRLPLTFDMLRRRYARREMLQLSAAELLALDAHYYKAWPAQPERIVALDRSEAALGYAQRVGVVDEAVAADFELDAPTGAHLAALSGVDIVVSTGAVGYVGPATFRAILSAVPRAPWVASFVLRMFDYAPIADTLAAHGLVTEKLGSAAFVQRRFKGVEEADGVLSVLRERGVDPHGLEADGLLYAELYLSRPAESVAAMPLDQLVTVASGRNIAFGPRLLAVRGDGEGRYVRAR